MFYITKKYKVTVVQRAHEQRNSWDNKTYAHDPEWNYWPGIFSWDANASSSDKATASSHVLSLLVKNEERVETATSPLQNATEDDNAVRQSGWQSQVKKQDAGAGVWKANLPVTRVLGRSSS